MARVQKHGTLSVMHARLCRDKANVLANSKGELWHKRLGHMSERGVHMLAEKNLLPEVKGMHFEKCVDCLARKQTGLFFTLGH